MRHAAGHDGHQFGAGKPRQKWADGERRLGTSEEDAGGDVHGFGAAGAHESHHEPRHLPDDPLHHSVVVKNRKEGRDEDDGRKHLEGEIERRPFLAQVTEQERRTGVGVTQKVGDDVAEPGEERAAGRNSQYQKGENDLQRQAPSDGFKADGSPVSGKQIGQRDHRNQPENAREAAQTDSPSLNTHRLAAVFCSKPANSFSSFHC